MIGSPEFLETVVLAAEVMVIAAIIAAAAFQIIKDWAPQITPTMMAKGSGLMALILTAITLKQAGVDPYIAVCATLMATQVPKALHDGVRAIRIRMNGDSSV